MFPVDTPGQYGQYGIPAAFLRDDDPPPPPPSDPHWREWPNYDGDSGRSAGSGRSHRLLGYAAPVGALLMLGMLFLLIKLIVPSLGLG